jgi:hypothetical protein
LLRSDFPSKGRRTTFHHYTRRTILHYTRFRYIARDRNFSLTISGKPAKRSASSILSAQQTRLHPHQRGIIA